MSTALEPEQLRAAVAEAYAFTGPNFVLGTAVDQSGTPLEAAQVRMPLATLNRHGLIAGATGTGKTKTLQILA